jgi:hypothetical protein
MRDRQMTDISHDQLVLSQLISQSPDRCEICRELRDIKC